MANKLKVQEQEAIKNLAALGWGIRRIARELDLTETAVRRWVEQAEIDTGRGAAGALTTTEREELAEARREIRTLRMERDILTKCMVRPLPSSVISAVG